MTGRLARKAHERLTATLTATASVALVSPIGGGKETCNSHHADHPGRAGQP